MMQVGFASRDITPDIGATLDGFIARSSVSSAIDCPLNARALWMAEGNERGLLISMDLLGIADTWSERMLAQLAAHVGIEVRHIILHCTHTHAGPMTAPMRGIGAADARYLATLESTLLNLSTTARTAAEPVDVIVGRSPIHMTVNRRIVGSDGVATFGCNEKAPRDNHVRVMAFIGKQNRTLLFNHACHPYDIGPQHALISSDFFGHAAEALHSKGWQAIAFNGCAADQAPRRAYEGPQAACEDGLLIAQAAMDAVSHGKAIETPRLVIASSRLSLPHEPMLSFDQIEAQLHDVDRTVRNEDRADAQVTCRIQSAWKQWLGDLREVMDLKHAIPDTVVRVAAMQIGNITLASLPGEIFWSTGLELCDRLQANADDAWMLGYCFGYSGYIPPKAAYPLGGYEVNEAHRYVGLWPFHRGAAETIVEHVSHLASGLAM